MLQIYWGLGKGKTSAANGMALRAHGYLKKVLIVRFFKGIPSSEDISFKKLKIPVINNYSSTKFVFQMNDDEKNKEKQNVKKTLLFLTKNYQKYDLIILDEFLDIVDKNINFFSELFLSNLIKKIKNKNNEIIITGHIKLKKIFLQADLITYFEKIIHYFDNGIKARKGFEY